MFPSMKISVTSEQRHSMFVRAGEYSNVIITAKCCKHVFFLVCYNIHSFESSKYFFQTFWQFRLISPSFSVQRQGHIFQVLWLYCLFICSLQFLSYNFTWSSRHIPRLFSYTYSQLFNFRLFLTAFVVMFVSYFVTQQLSRKPSNRPP